MLRRERSHCCSAVSLLVLVAALVGAASAGATFPGRDGAIVYSSYLRTEDEFPPYATTEEYAIKSADYHGGHMRIKITFASPTVAPSGRRIVIAFLRPDGVYRVRPDGSRLRRVAFPDPVGHVVWSPSGTRFAVDLLGEGGGILTLRLPGG